MRVSGRFSAESFVANRAERMRIRRRLIREDVPCTRPAFEWLGLEPNPSCFKVVPDTFFLKSGALSLSRFADASDDESEDEREDLRIANCFSSDGVPYTRHEFTRFFGTEDQGLWMWQHAVPRRVSQWRAGGHARLLG